MLKYGLAMMTRFAFAWLVFLYSGYAQTPAIHPPGKLYECDLLGNNKNCGLWTWDGNAYQGVWPESKSMGTVTVVQMDKGGVLMNRVDVTGRLAGLKAEYTGKWDGTTLTDGHVIFSVGGGQLGTMSWTATTNIPPNLESAAPSAVETVNAPDPNQIPLALNAFQFGGNTARYQITNGGTSPLTAYALAGGKPSGQIWSHVEDTRISSTGPVNPGAITLGPEFWNTFEYPRGMRVTAAIFADGTAKGDRHVLDTIMAKRQEQLFTYSAMAPDVCSLSRQKKAPQEMIVAMTAKKASYVHTYADRKYVSSGGEEAFNAVMQQLAALKAEPPGDAARKTLQFIEERSTQLASDPVKDGSGKLYIHASQALSSCP